MGPDQEQPQAKRVRLSDAPQQPQAAAAAQHAAKPSACLVTASSSAAAAAPAAAPRAPSSSAAAAAATKPAAFIVDAHQAVQFRAVSSPDAEGIAAEVAAGGKPVSVEYLHQHFGDSEQIRGFSGLKITIWVHVRTYHVWVDISFEVKRPGADKLGPIFEGAFPAGYCRSQEEFVTVAAAAAASMPDLLALGDCVGTVQLPPTAYGITAAAAAPAGSAAAEGPVEVSVRRFQISTAPPEVKALHTRMEPLLLFTIDGAQFIETDDLQWELMLPVARARDGGCVVMGLTTLFNFFAYPASCRLRVSQVLVLSPWQGLGLGKALLKLSYDLARSRCCADLTVEDPTPNLQRVREKLEVEMLRGLDWVTQQARKCLDAAARGELRWPHWEPLREGGAAGAAGGPDQDQGQGGKETTQQQQQQQQQDREGQQAVAAAAAAEDVHVPGQDQGQGQQAPTGHPLLAAHAFFAALGAVPPPHLALPPSVETEATQAAEARWRQRLEKAEDAATAAAAVTEAPESSAEAPSVAAAPGPSGAAVTVAGGGSGSGSGSEESGGGGGGGGALAPSSSFVSAISRELKIHKGQIRIVWEALLWCEAGAGALSRPAVREALEQLISTRLESQHFSSVGRLAASKRLVETNRTTQATAPGADEAEKDVDFFMYRPAGRQGQGQGQAGGGAAAAAAAAAGESGGADEAAVATGRLNLTQVSADDKARRMSELLSERRQQLESLAAAFNAAHRRRQLAARC
ncbi:hypothetical protein PLESTB_001798300 [Pleodorina starrii]|uniref:histone acetyltransferase n=1 Tax=Pleodorina starrii TaxID=330485 RepID=A0A9W6C0Y5_9CHLO|nr:hypothetical protein PLESTB_001798300 [Pleodorina starrii]GLC67902.1 hypothetical protein PLESTF_000621200 [Pleodorina starrii]